MSAPADGARLGAFGLALRALWMCVRRFGPLALLCVPGTLAAVGVMAVYYALRAAGWGVSSAADEVATSAALGRAGFELISTGVWGGWVGGAIGAAVAASGGGAVAARVGLQALARAPVRLAVIGCFVAAPGVAGTYALDLAFADAEPASLADAAVMLAVIVGFISAVLYLTVWIGPAPIVAALEGRGVVGAFRRASQLSSGYRIGAAAGGGLLLLAAGMAWWFGMAMAFAASGAPIEASPETVRGVALRTAVFEGPMNLAFGVWLALLTLRVRALKEGGGEDDLARVFA